MLHHKHGTMSTLFNTCFKLSHVLKRNTLVSTGINSKASSYILKRGFQALSGVLFRGEYEWKDPVNEDEIVHVSIIDQSGKKTTVRGKVGDNLLYLAHRYKIDMEGACEASLACTTCHVYVGDSHIDKLEEASEEEEDLLDIAPLLEPNSRLGCQIILTKDLDGIEVTLPKMTRNFYVDGHVPKPH